MNTPTHSITKSEFKQKILLLMFQTHTLHEQSTTLKKWLHYKTGQTKVMSKRLQWRLNEITCLKHLTVCLVCSKHPLQIIKPLVRNNLGHITALVLILHSLYQACSFQPVSTFFVFWRFAFPMPIPTGQVIFLIQMFIYQLNEGRKKARKRKKRGKEGRILSSVAQKHCLQLLKSQLTRHESRDSSICSP